MTLLPLKHPIGGPILVSFSVSDFLVSRASDHNTKHSANQPPTATNTCKGENIVQLREVFCVICLDKRVFREVWCLTDIINPIDAAVLLFIGFSVVLDRFAGGEKECMQRQY